MDPRKDRNGLKPAGRKQTHPALRAPLSKLREGPGVSLDSKSGLNGISGCNRGFSKPTVPGPIRFMRQIYLAQAAFLTGNCHAVGNIVFFWVICDAENLLTSRMLCEERVDCRFILRYDNSLGPIPPRERSRSCLRCLHGPGFLWLRHVQGICTRASDAVAQS